MRQLRIARRRSDRPTAGEPGPSTGGLRSSDVLDASVSATLAHIDEVLGESR